MQRTLGHAAVLGLWLVAGCGGMPNSGPVTQPAPPPSGPNSSGDTAAREQVRAAGIGVVQAVGGVASTGGVTVTPSVPAAGDLLMLFGAVDQHAPRTATAPVGFSEITAAGGTPLNGGVCYPRRTCIAIYYKVASANEPTSYTFTDGDPNAPISASLVEFGGVDPAHPILTQAWGLGRGTSVSCPAAGRGDLGVCLIADSAGTAASMLAAPTGVTSGWSLVAGTAQIPTWQSSMAFTGPPNTAMTATVQTPGSTGGWVAMAIGLQAKGGAAPPPSPTPTQAPAGARRAMWVWASPDNQRLVDFAKAHGVQELFYSVSSNVAGSELARLRSLKTLTDAAGITLDALGGDPTWATTNTAGALRWETNVMNTGLFAGAHFDIEPAALPSWKTDNAATIAAYLSALDRIRANSPCHFEVDVPYWYGKYKAVGYPSLADAVIAKTDETTTMSYRNTPSGHNSLFSVGQDMLVRAQAAGKPTRLGAETNNVQPPSITFYTVGNTAMQTGLVQVDAAAAAYASYQGIAVEDYNGWSNLSGTSP